jgi:hypothetical protein
MLWQVALTSLMIAQMAGPGETTIYSSGTSYASPVAYSPDASYSPASSPNGLVAQPTDTIGQQPTLAVSSSAGNAVADSSTGIVGASSTGISSTGAIVDPSTGVIASQVNYDMAPDKSEYVTRGEVEADLKQWAWRKGDFRIVPYGTIWGDTSYDSQRSKIGDYCLWIESPTLHPNDPDYNVDAKSTRIGLDMFGPGIPCFGDAKIDGKVEVDFQGIFVTRNKPGLLLRHAYIEAKNDDYRLLVGQTWDVMSPLAIPTLDYTAGSGVGNLGYRRAQFRAERYYALSDTSMVTLQGSINANVVTDYVSETTISADPGPYPDIQSRVAITLGQRTGPCAHPVVIGFSGHCGEQEFDFRNETPNTLDLSRTTWSANADFLIPFNATFGFQGEFFTGENLSNYMGGILQGVDKYTHAAIHSTGGWADVWYKWTPQVTTHTGYAVDDPLNSDFSAKSTTARTYNQMIYTNILYDVTKNLQLGFEVDYWKTFYKAMEDAEAVRLDCAVKYTF